MKWNYSDWWNIIEWWCILEGRKLLSYHVRDKHSMSRLYEVLPLKISFHVTAKINHRVSCLRLHFAVNLEINHCIIWLCFVLQYALNKSFYVLIASDISLIGVLCYSTFKINRFTIWLYEIHTSSINTILYITSNVNHIWIYIEYLLLTHELHFATRIEIIHTIRRNHVKHFLSIPTPGRIHSHNV